MPFGQFASPFLVPGLPVENLSKKPVSRLPCTTLWTGVSRPPGQRFAEEESHSSAMMHQEYKMWNCVFHRGWYRVIQLVCGATHLVSVQLPFAGMCQTPILFVLAFLCLYCNFWELYCTHTIGNLPPQKRRGARQKGGGGSLLEDVWHYRQFLEICMKLLISGCVLDIAVFFFWRHLHECCSPWMRSGGSCLIFLRHMHECRQLLDLFRRSLLISGGTGMKVQMLFIPGCFLEVFVSCIEAGA